MLSLKSMYSLNEVSYLFIDGGCLRSIVEGVSNTYFSGDLLELNYKAIGQEFTKVFYYDCPIPRKTDESNEDYQNRLEIQRCAFKKISRVAGYQIYEGISRRRRKVVEQKTVDVSIAVDMLTHTFMRNMQRATLLTSDLDFLPLVNALVQHGMYVDLWYHQGHTNEELICAADAQKSVNVLDIYWWSNSDFRKNHQIPIILRLPDLDLRHLLKVDEIGNRSHSLIEHYKHNDGDHVVIFKIRDVFQYFKFVDLQILISYLMELHPDLQISIKSSGL